MNRETKRKQKQNQHHNFYTKKYSSPRAREAERRILFPPKKKGETK